MTRIIQKLGKKGTVAVIVGMLAAASLLVTLLVNPSYSRYAGSENENAENELQEFYAAAKLYIKSETDGTLTEVPLSEKDGKRFFNIPVEDFDKTVMDITYQGKARTYMRFKFDVSWYYTDNTGQDVLILHQLPGFTYGDGLQIYDNRVKDNWIYFQNVIVSDTEEEQTFEVITKVDKKGDFIDPNDPGDQSQFVRVYIIVDCVQFNRVLELWNIEKLPWQE